MSQPSESSPNKASSDTDVEVTEPQSSRTAEPLTAQSAIEWNRYYDRYVAGGVLLLVLLVSAHKITGSSSRIWPLIKAGEMMTGTGVPMTVDRFSFTESGNRWVNIPWLFEIKSHFLYNWGRTLFTADEQLGVQIGAGFLVAFTVLARVLTAWVLLALRRKGPGLWWYAVVAAIALGFVYSPRNTSFEIGVGGIARQANVGSEAWGHFLLALMLLMIDRGMNLGRRGFLYAIPLVFLLWANWDESFAIGLIVLTCSAIGFLVDRRKKDPAQASPLAVLSIVAASFAVCLANPSTYHVFGEAFAPIMAIPQIVFGSTTLLPMPDHLAYVGKISDNFLMSRVEYLSLGPDIGRQVVRMRQVYFAGVVIAGLASFVLNRRDFRVGRFLAYIVMAVLWAGLGRLSSEFAIVFAYVVALNGQEWYLATYGDQGRTTSGWTAWSVGGRAVTILVFFLVMAKTLTGYEYTVGRPTFGFGMETSEFDFEAAEYLKKLKLSGEVMNLGEPIGDALVWRGYPLRKSFIDRRRGLFGLDLYKDIATFRSAFVPNAAGTAIEENVETWSAVLDKHNASAVIYAIDENENLPLYFGMIRSKNWIPLRDDGRTVTFGRADAKSPAEDLEVFKANRLDAAEIVFKRQEFIPFPDRSPSAMTFIDRIIRNRSLSRTQPHVEAAKRWLLTGMSESPTGIADAAHCLMAIREARIAIAANPDDSAAYRTLDAAYKMLTTNETSLMVGTLETAPNDYLNFRARQRITALNFAIQTTPPPLDQDDKRNLAQTYLDLAFVHRAVGDLDLERDALAAAQSLLGPVEFPESEQQRLDALDDTIERFKDDLQKFATEVGADGVQKASRAVQAGFPGLALRELEDAESQGVSPDRLLLILVDLYCRTGQPEKANELIVGRTVNDQALYSGPGTPAYRIGTVNFLLGYYDNTANLWRDYAITQVRGAESNIALNLARELVSGQALESTNNVISLTGIPGQPGLLENEANWLAELGFCLLESGSPQKAGEQFAQALKINPAIPIRPVLEDYLTKIGQPIPETEGQSTATEPTVSDPKTTEPAAAEGEPSPEKPTEASPTETPDPAPNDESKAETSSEKPTGTPAPETPAPAEESKAEPTRPD